MSEDFPIKIEQRGGVAVWTIDRPDRMNSLSRATLFAFGKLAREAAVDPKVRAVIVTGAGEKAFCAGADLKERQGMTENDVRVQVELYRSELGPLDRSPKPVVAAINGVAFGGGLELALLCDLRVAAAHAQLALPETSLGIIPGAGGTQRLPRLVGPAVAKDLICSGRQVAADEALRIGLVDRVVEPDDLHDEARAWAATFASGAVVAQGLAKRAIDRGLDITLNGGLDLEQQLFVEVFATDDARIGVESFLEHGPGEARFTGR
jgi:enoyl-CoA hydratase/carnithine racemase